MKMTGNTIFITGGTSGIGRALAEAFHKLGNKVIIAGRRKALLDEVSAANPGIDGIELNIADAADIERVATKLISEYPKLNVLINNAGIMPFDDPAGKIDDSVLQKIIETNLLGPIRLTSALVDHLKAQPDATIIHNTSVLAFVPLAGNAVYSSTKAALHSYSLSQRFALRDTNVKVQEIAPPWVDTDLVKKSGDPRAMPLDVFIEKTMAGLATEAPEVFVEEITALRDNPGLKEHQLVHDFNAALVADPIPV
ncbi:putative oxidoreductase [Rhizobium pisi]|uniref:Putative oxidoreductase n=1 Tax=Rhizobium pisi TaxID=574561 RepID=A0A3R9AYS5_9HYPH|nr:MULTISPECIES: SDR family NAD(P)-dependent oxidoreductase [Rhizobium]MBB3138142.1 putative oxidoreductase [Rhizobium pisi]RSB64737.1 SDR family NAD(P)-dependent oxidoreductase [Rhizobium pisi]TAV45382.1 SDR family NAD(P)-dependent oxidoreductase [Rhizobium leguminosarum]TAV45940.1 SDR family NAD(P)-dependent oxidoreductase [Rhizobium leguminosarum]TAV63795.1 SDR family NAD(P)-dependent oxidoreductase [Rhizobium leguminosarum]